MWLAGWDGAAWKSQTIWWQTNTARLMWADFWLGLICLTQQRNALSLCGVGSGGTTAWWLRQGLTLPAILITASTHLPWLARWAHSIYFNVAVRPCLHHPSALAHLSKVHVVNIAATLIYLMRKPFIPTAPHWYPCFFLIYQNFIADMEISGRERHA